MKNSGYELSLSDRRTYTRYKVFKGHFDFATSLGLDIENVETLPRGASDHLPILVSAEYGQDSGPIQGTPPS
jgi:endonuclease/exonuclease/phosphatase (EEP) superfamily protein YafD